MHIDYLDVKTQAQSYERRLQEENELLRLEQKDTQSRFQSQLTKAGLDIKKTENEAGKKTDEIVHKFRLQVQVRDENLEIIKVYKKSR